ncbi:MAG: hypothetical protein ACKN9T_06760 [Candidatus Methylumidiphilus sp.]
MLTLDCGGLMKLRRQGLAESALVLARALVPRPAAVILRCWKPALACPIKGCGV